MSKAKPKRALALPLVALAIFLPVLAACGESDDSSGGSGTAADGGATGKDNDQYVKFAQCMRQNGVPEWPDPIDGTKFRLKLGTVDPNSQQFKAASQACKSLAPPGWDGSRQDPANQARALKYAQCMRKNGVPQFPDPQGGALDLGDINPDSPQFKAAAQKCQSLRPAGGGG
ncbi:hypothetical protein [Actinomadura sp. HBU206391]|uniref:hypothetical protein n=1 Tax=Actinomadura sp. HBU206391 TaxID=2731692 RepID=UPI00164F4537|nr:hypothetical protein [Actinomadura sp. HBU206391]MBC6459124.1 hypothetical protein [Actinomadura sp. HBU206391]